MSILKRQVDFSPNLASLFSLMKDNSSGLFQLKQYKQYKIKIFETFKWSDQNLFKFLISILKLQFCQFLFNLCIILHCHDTNPLWILRSYPFNFVLKDPIKVPILRLSKALVKIFHIPHIIFQTTSQFFFKFCITLQCHER